MSYSRSLPDYTGSQLNRDQYGSEYETIQTTASGGYEKVWVSNDQGWGADNAFWMERFRDGAVTTSGISWGSTYWWNAEYPELVLDGVVSGFPAGSFSPPPEYDSAAFQQRLMAGTNPTRASVNLPVSLLELREIPMMLNQAAAMLSRGKFRDVEGRYWKHMSPTARLASVNLATNFGWKPLLSDIKNIVTLSTSVEKRKKEWDNVIKNGGSRRRYKLWHATSRVDRFVAGRPGWLGGADVQHYGETTVWGTIRWKAADTYPFKGSPPDSYIRKQILGLTMANFADNVWQAMPWSWMVDWFTDFGGFIQSHQGGGLTWPSAPCIMTYMKTTGQVVSNSYDNTSSYEENGIVRHRGDSISHGGYDSLYESKRREPSPLDQPQAAFTPYLSAGQLSILGSLYATKARAARLRI